MGSWNEHRLRQTGTYAKASYRLETERERRTISGDLLRSPNDMREMREAWKAAEGDD